MVSAPAKPTQTKLYESRPSSGLQIQDVACGHQQTLRLTGELDMSSAPAVDAAVERICAAGAAEALVLDLAPLTFMDSSGLRTVLIAQSLCAESGVELRLIPGRAQVQRLFEITGLQRELPLAGTVGSND
jgi:anti-anti-sigma factor